MIIEDPDIVQKINEKLSPQIRVWGVETTTSGFNCYNLVDSRVYEYLMPSYCLLPPHPSTHLGRKIVELAEKAGELDDVKARQEEVTGWWEEVDQTYIKPILDSVPEDVREIVQKSLFWYEPEQGDANQGDADASTTPAPAPAAETKDESAQEKPTEKIPFKMTPQQQMVTDTIKAIKAAYIKARKNYRVPAARVARLQECLSHYEGTKNFHNFTVQKTFKDASAKRHIKSFKVNPEPVVINGTEWLSLKVHGQSFMMHQIRKMVAMAALIVRAGCTPDRMLDTYGPDRIAIPKAPGLGLLLERPIFDNYNSKAEGLGRNPIDFDKYATAMNEFKQRDIYDRIFREEEETTQLVISNPDSAVVIKLTTSNTDSAPFSTTLIITRKIISCISLLVVSRLLNLLQLPLTARKTRRLPLEIKPRTLRRMSLLLLNLKKRIILPLKRRVINRDLGCKSYSRCQNKRNIS